MCKVIEAPELLTHADYADFKLRSKNRDALNALISEKLIKRTSAEWIAAFNKAGVPCGPIYKINEMFDDPQVKHIGMAQPVKHYALGDINLVGQGVTLTRTPSELRVAAPDRGAQNEELLQEYGVEYGVWRAPLVHESIPETFSRPRPQPALTHPECAPCQTIPRSRKPAISFAL